LGLVGLPVRARAWLARRGVPAAVRRAAHVVVGSSGLAWVVGERIDAAHAVAPTTRRVALLEVVRARFPAGLAPETGGDPRVPDGP
jgi:hypothetical protein